MTATTTDRVDQIIAFEQGDLDAEGTLALFAGLIADGTAWDLQGSYGRTADFLIRNGIISADGEILRDLAD